MSQTSWGEISLKDVLRRPEWRYGARPWSPAWGRSSGERQVSTNRAQTEMATWFHLPVGWKVHEGPGLGGGGPPRSSDQTCSHSNRLRCECYGLYFGARDGLSAAAMQDIRFRPEAASSFTCSTWKTPVNWSPVWEPTTSCVKVSRSPTGAGSHFCRIFPCFVGWIWSFPLEVKSRQQSGT